MLNAQLLDYITDVSLRAHTEMPKDVLLFTMRLTPDFVITIITYAEQSHVLLPVRDSGATDDA